MPYAPGEPTGERTIAESRDPLIGAVVGGRFRIDFQLAAGGFGAIYIAIDTRSDREVALKVLHKSLVTDPAIVRRFRREGAVLAKLRNPHTVRAYELGELEGGGLFIVMELLRGETLHDRLWKRGPAPWQQAVATGRDVCSSLVEAHGLGIVHRDLKTANIFIARNGDDEIVKVLDFGIAKILRGSDVPQTQLTIAGALYGTIEYMPPEQLQGDQITRRSDIYALGIVMYEMLVGQRPFTTRDGPQLLAAMLAGAPRPQPAMPIPAELERIVMRCLAFQPRDRFKHAGDLHDELSRLLGESPSFVAARDSEEAPTWLDTRARARIDARQRPPEPPPEPPQHVAAATPVAQMPAFRPVQARAPQQVPVQFPPPAPPAASPPRPQPQRPADRGYSLATTMRQDALVRLIIWIVVTVALVVIAIVLALRL